MKSSPANANWVAARNYFTWVSIVSGFAFVALMVTKGLLWLLNYRTYPFNRQITVIAAIAFASLICSVLVLATPGLIRGFLLLRKLNPITGRNIGATTAIGLVGVLIATLWFSSQRSTHIDSVAVPNPQASIESEQSRNEPPASLHEPGGQGQDTQQTNVNSISLDNVDSVRESQSAPEGLRGNESKAPPAEAGANVAVLRNGSDIPFIRKEQTSKMTRLYVPGGHIDVPTADINSFEKDQSPGTVNAIASGAMPRPSGSHIPDRTALRRPAIYRSLPTGTRIREDNDTSGHGELTVENGTDEDAVVRLYDLHTDQTERWFFVKANTSAHVGQIPAGVFKLAFTTGLNWVEANDSFTWHPSYDEFERTFNFLEERNSEGIRYHEISVTLNPVPLGNVHTKAITRDEFLKGYRHVKLQR